MNKKLNIAQSAGGKVMAIRQRQDAIARYYLNPSKCHHCGTIIPVLNERKVSEARNKQFCNLLCYNNHRKNHDNTSHIHGNAKFAVKLPNIPENKVKIIHKYHCLLCGKTIGRIRKTCADCARIEKLNGSFYAITKGDLLSNKKYQKAREMIRKHAHKLFMFTSLEKCCRICGYNKHFEVCHIKPVSEFEDSATILQINDIKNLIPLCPTHHWEFDNGILQIPPKLPDANQN